MTTTKLILAITESLLKATEAVRKHDEKEAEKILQNTLYRWFYHRPFMLHNQN